MIFSQREAYRVASVRLKEQILTDNRLVRDIMDLGNFDTVPDLCEYEFILIKKVTNGTI